MRPPACQFFCDALGCGEPFWTREAAPECPRCHRREFVTLAAPAPCQRQRQAATVLPPRPACPKPATLPPAQIAAGFAAIRESLKEGRADGC
jgi:hypothetical protein